MDLEEALKSVKTVGPVPGHVQITRIIGEKIENGELPCGTRLPGERALAQMCGVSRTTVRQALDALVDRGLIEKFTGRGIFVSAPPEPKVVACVLPGHDPRYHWGSVLSQAIVSEARVNGWEPATYLVTSDEDRARLAKHLREGRIHGVLSMGMSRDIGGTVPTVDANLLDTDDEYRVYIDYYSMIHQAVKFLVERGRKKIGMASYESKMRATRDGMRAYRDVLDEFDLPLREEWIVQEGGLEEQGEAAVRQIWSLEERPDALIFMDDWQGLGGTRTLVELGVQVPEEVMVVTHMNRGYNPPYPVPVVGIQVDPNRIAQEMVVLLGVLESGERPLRKMILVEPSLKVPEGWSI